MEKFVTLLGETAKRDESIKNKAKRKNAVKTEKTRRN